MAKRKTKTKAARRKSSVNKSRTTRKKTPARKQRPRVTSAPVPMMSTGTTGLRRSARYVHDEWHPKLRGRRAIKTFREMRDNDAVCGSVYYSMDSFIRQAPQSIVAADDSPKAEMIKDHVDSCLTDMSMTMNEFLSDANTMIWAGFSLHGIDYKIRRGPDAPASFLRSKHNDGLVGWKKLPIRAQDTVWEWEFQDDGGIDGAYQQSSPHYKRTFLPIEDLLLFRTMSNKNSPEGRSIFRNSYRSWYFLKMIQELEAIGVERDMAGMLVFNMPVEFFAEDADDDDKATVEKFRKIAERMRRGEYESLMYPTSEDSEGKTGFDAKLLQSGGRRPIDTNEIIKRLESRIALSVLGEAVLLGMQGNVGSWSLASSKTHMFAVALRAVMEAQADVISRFAIPRLVKANGWSVELSPTFEFGDIESDDSMEVVNALAAAVGAGLITGGPVLEEYLRIRMGLPLEEDLSDGQVQDAAGEMQERDEQGVDTNNSDAALQNVIPIKQQENTQTATLNVDQAADYLSMSRNSILAALRRGQLPGAKIGMGWRIVRSALDEFMRGRRAA